MQPSFDLFFVSSNNHKFKEAKIILDSFKIKIGFLKHALEEVQSNSMEVIASKKAKFAFSKFNKPVIIEDDGLFIESLQGFPGPYSSYVFEKIGNFGILNLVHKKRNAKFVSLITYCDGKITKSFIETVTGSISNSEKGKGWGYDPIFVPKNMNKTFAELKNKNEISHRYLALKSFSNWYLQRQEL